VRIVFWGSERGSYVTSNMIILGSYLACKKGYRIAMMELADEKRGLETYYPQISEYYVRDYLRTLVRRQLYCVTKKSWNVREAESVVDRIRYLEANMDMVFINVANRTDEEAKSLMHNASLLVVNLKQSFQAFNTYYAHYMNLSARVFLLIGNYYEDGTCEKKHLQEKYDILDSQLAVIPNNPEYQMASSKSSVDRYIKRDSLRFVSAIKRQFMQAVDKAVEQLYEAASKAEQQKKR